jgi:hypothetical protein
VDTARSRSRISEQVNAVSAVTAPSCRGTSVILELTDLHRFKPVRQAGVLRCAGSFGVRQKFGFILANIVAMMGWSILLGWTLWHLINFAFT